jgi:hypothetical protein
MEAQSAPDKTTKNIMMTHRIIARWRCSQFSVVLCHLIPFPNDNFVEKYRLLLRRLDIGRVVVGFRRGRGRVDARTEPVVLHGHLAVHHRELVTCLPQPVFLPKRFKLYDVRMIPHREHDVDEQRVVVPLSPRRHSLVVPCQRRFSFPGDRPAAANLPRASTDALLILGKTRGVCKRKNRHPPICIIFRDGSGVSNDFVYSTHSWTRCRVPPRGLELVGNYTL